MAPAMIAIFNFMALIMVLAAVGAAAGIGLWLKLEGLTPIALIAGAFMVVIDGAYRWKTKRGRWIHPDGGGAVFFIPVWILGLAVVAFALWQRFGLPQ